MTADGRLYESREVAEILGVPPGQIAKWKHDKRLIPAGLLPRSGHHIPMWHLSTFTDPRPDHPERLSLVEEYEKNRRSRDGRNA